MFATIGALVWVHGACMLMTGLQTPSAKVFGLGFITV